MKFEKRDGRVYSGNQEIIGPDRRYSSLLDRTQDEINEAFRCFDEPERPELPQEPAKVWWDNGRATMGMGYFDDDGHLVAQVGNPWTLTPDFMQQIAEVSRLVLEYAEVKRRAAKPEIDVSRLVEPEQDKWAAMSDRGDIAPYSTREASMGGGWEGGYRVLLLKENES